MKAEEQNTREAAWIQYIKTNPTKPTDRWAFMQGFDAGAASVDRAGIVRDVLNVIRRRYNVDLVDAEKDELLSQYKGEGK